MTTMNDTKQELRLQVFYDPPSIEEALKNFMSWFVAQNQVHKKNFTTQEVLQMTRLLSKCINQHVCSSDINNRNKQEAMVASIWNPVQQDASRKVTQTLGRVALQAVWDQLDTSLLRGTDQSDDTEEEDSVNSFLRSFEAALFASLEEDEHARLIWSTDRGKDELTRRAVQRQVEAARRSGDANETDTTVLPRIEEISEANQG